MTDAPAAGPFRWAVLGTGPVSRKFVHGLGVLGGAARVTRVATRRIEAARAFADRFAIPVASDDPADLMADDVDAVYIATPPAAHEAHALAAIAAGKPCLVEKPLAPDAAAAARIAAAARAAGVFCMEAMWTRFLPALDRAVARAADLGTPLGFDGAFLGAARPASAASLFDPERGGGALLHRGVYPLSLARLLLGPVTRCDAVGRMGETGVEEDAVLTLTHESGATSAIRASLRAAGPSRATLYGTEGTLEIGPPIWRPETLHWHPANPATMGDSGPRRAEAFRESPAGQRIARWVAPLRAVRPEHVPVRGNGYGHEALALMEAVAAGRTEAARMPLDQSVEILRLVDEARAQIMGTGP